MEAVSVEIMRADTVTKAGHVYPAAVLEAAVERFRTTGTPAVVCLGVPDACGVHLHRATHKVSDLRLDNGVLLADVFPLNTASHRDYEAMLAAGLEFVFRACGTGSTREEENGRVVVQADYVMSALYLSPKACPPPASAV